VRALTWRQHLWAIVIPVLMTAIAYLVGLLVLGYLPVVISDLFRQ
jgi:hypothetical protein